MIASGGIVNDDATNNSGKASGRLGIISELAQWASSDLINLSHAITEIVERRGASKAPSLKQIKVVVAAASGVLVDDLSSERRDRDIKRPRKVAMALCKHLTQAGYRRIGSAFERDASSTQRSIRQTEPLIAFAAATLPADAGLDEWAATMLANYETVMGPE
jgi:chromosomal replication initiation ATPase DnaA